MMISAVQPRFRSLRSGARASRPFTPGDVRRVRLASVCAEAGLPLEGIGAAMAAGKLTPAFLDHPRFR